MKNSAVFTHKNKRESNQDIAILSKTNEDGNIIVNVSQDINVMSPDSLDKYVIYSCLLDGMGGMPGDSQPIVALAVKRLLYMFDEGDDICSVVRSLTKTFAKNMTGATLCRCGLLANFVLEYNWLGDSRIYHYKKAEGTLVQLTIDNNESERLRRIDMQNMPGEDIPFDKYAEYQHLLCGFLGCNFVNFAQYLIDVYATYTHNTTSPNFYKTIEEIISHRGTEYNVEEKIAEQIKIADAIVTYQSATVQCSAGDVILLCSDGAITALSNEPLESIFNACCEDMDALAETICSLALECGSTDNQTVSCFIVE